MSVSHSTSYRLAIVTLAASLALGAKPAVAQSDAGGVAAPRVLVTAYFRADSLSRLGADQLGRELASPDKGPPLVVVPRGEIARVIDDHVYQSPQVRFELEDLRALITMLRATVLYDIAVEPRSSGLQAAVVAVPSGSETDSSTVASAQGPDLEAVVRELARALRVDALSRARMPR